MTFTYRRAYAGKVQGVILDWSGTTVDYGSRAPALVFVELFAAQGVPITLDEARVPMGMYKRDHLRAILHMPRVAAAWREARGQLPTEDDVTTLYEAFIPAQIAIIARYADLIPGVAETIAAYRARGLKVGSCTGYTTTMMDSLLPAAAALGYAPDAVVCPDEVDGGRPAPWMCYENARRLGVYPMESLVKIGDTPVDVTEGLNAGMWTIALAQSGNELGLSADEVSALSPDELKARLAPIYAKLYAAGAHYVVDSLADTLPILDAIEARLARGEKP